MRRAVRAATADGYALNVVNYTTMANAHAQHGDPHNAFSIFAAMRDARIRPTNVTLRVALKAAERIPDARYATDAILECLRWVARERVQPCEKSWNMAIRSLAQRKAFPQLRNVFTWMHNRSLDSNVGNVPSPNQYSYNTYIHALGKDARFKEAFKLFLDMLMSTVHPDVVTYNTLLEITLGDDKGALGDASNIVHAILKSMNRRNVKPNTTTETLILRLLCSNGKTVDPSLIWSRVMPVFADEESRKQVDKMVSPKHIAQHVHLLRTNHLTNF